MGNPFSATNYSEQTDLDLVQAGLGGSKPALEMLVLRHQPFIYNIALKMTMSADDAADITQEVLSAMTVLFEMPNVTAAQYDEVMQGLEGLARAVRRGACIMSLPPPRRAGWSWTYGSPANYSINSPKPLCL